jgi:hypothetical protein
MIKLKSLPEIKKEYDFITKVCAASNFINSGDLENRIKEEKLCGYGKKESLINALEDNQIYDILSQLFTNAEINIMATILNNLPERVEKKAFESIENEKNKLFESLVEK